MSLQIRQIKIKIRPVIRPRIELLRFKLPHSKDWRGANFLTYEEGRARVRVSALTCCQNLALPASILHGQNTQHQLAPANRPGAQTERKKGWSARVRTDQFRRPAQVQKFAPDRSAICTIVASPIRFYGLHSSQFQSCKAFSGAICECNFELSEWSVTALFYGTSSRLQFLHFFFFFAMNPHHYRPTITGRPITFPPLPCRDQVAFL